MLGSLGIRYVSLSESKRAQPADIVGKLKAEEFVSDQIANGKLRKPRDAFVFLPNHTLIFHGIRIGFRGLCV